VLPGIDDGPDDLEQTLAMLRAAAESGTATIAATPHLRPDFPDVHVDELADRCQSVRDAIEREGISIRLAAGAEVSLLWAVDASDEQLALASYGQRGTDLLIETPTMKLVGMDQFLYQLHAKGYRVVLGHPERSVDFERDHDPLRELVAQGVLLQVNADSVLGADGGGRIRRFARHLVTEGLAHAIASDGHRGTAWRPVTRLSDAAEAAAELVGPERAQWMTSAVPAAIVHGAELPLAPPVIQRPGRRRLFGR
jgi:protein-tyrosine phosphatase